MTQPSNGQALSPTQDNRPRYTGELLLRTRPRVYRQIIRLLSENVSAHQICKPCHVTRETVRAVEKREGAEISERKKSIIGILGNVAELGAGRMEETIGKASLRGAAIGTGIAVDKMLALSGQLPSTNIAIINMPNSEERELQNECHRRLRAVSIGESEDVKADIAWLAAYGRWKKAKPPNHDDRFENVVLLRVTMFHHGSLSYKRKLLSWRSLQGRDDSPSAAALLLRWYVIPRAKTESALFGADTDQSD